MAEGCDEALTNLYLYLDGEIRDESELDRIKGHLADCPPCGGAFDFEYRLKLVVRTHLQETVDPAMVERIRFVIRRERGL